jgi:hypothetical protein
MVKELITPNDVLSILNADFYSERARILAESKKAQDRIIKGYGNLETFLSNVELGVINRPNDSLFSPVYELYDGIFTLPDEKAFFEELNKCLELNTNCNLLEELGSFEETWVAALEPSSRRVIGGVNFVTYEMPEPIQSRGIDGTAQVIYLFVKPEYRNIGLG